MTDPRTSRIVKLYGPRDLRYEPHELPALGPGDVRLRTLLGAISAGTEAAWYFGTDPQLDPNFRPGRVAAARFPKTLGYEKVAVVTAVGRDVTSIQTGQRVAAYYGHAEQYVLAAERVIPVPESLSDEQALSYSLGTVAIHGVRRSRMQIGDDVLVTGLGFVGLLTVVMARAAGAGRVVATDPRGKRRELAVQVGADVALNPAEGDVGAMVRERFGPDGFDVALETSSSYDALCDCAASLRRNGRICVVSQLKGASTGHPVLGLEFHLNELELISADGRGDVAKLARWYFDAISRGAMPDVEALMTHRVPFDRIEDAYALLENDSDDVMKILVTYDGGTT